MIRPVDILVLVAVVLGSGCVDGTGGDRASFAVVADAVAPVMVTADGPAVIVATDDGWQLAITHATVALGPVYLWSGAPLLRASDQFQYGFLRGEFTAQAVVDLIATAGTSTPLGDGDGLAGEAQSGELWLAPPVSPATPATFTLAGVATRGADRVEFSGALTIDDGVVDEAGGDIAFEKRKVRGIPLTADVADGGTLHVGCDVRAWLTGVAGDDLLAAPAIEFPGSAWSHWFYQVRQAGRLGPWTLTWKDAQ